MSLDYEFKKDLQKFMADLSDDEAADCIGWMTQVMIYKSSKESGKIAEFIEAWGQDTFYEIETIAREIEQDKRQ